MSMLDVTLGVNTAALQTGLDRAKGQVSKFSSSAIAAFGAAFAIGGIAAFFSSLMVKFDRVQKLAERFGTSAESIQRMAFAAEQSGTQIEGLAGSLQKASRNADAAARGNSELEKSFGRLGVNAKTFIDLTPEEKLLALSRGFTGIGSAGERVNLALEIMGRSGAEALPLLLQGSDALREQMDSVAVASQASVDAIAQTNDAIDRLKTNIAATLAPVIGALEILVTGFVSLFQGMVAQVTTHIIGLSAITAQALQGNFKGAAQAAENWKTNIIANVNEVVNKFAELRGKGDALFGLGAPGAAPAPGSASLADDPTAADQSDENDKAANKAAESKATRIKKLNEEIYQKEKAAAEEKLALGDKILLTETQIASARQISADASDEELRLSKIAEALALEKQLGTLKQQQAEKLASSEESSLKTAEESSLKTAEESSLKTAEESSTRKNNMEQAQRDAESAADRAVFSVSPGLGGISSLAAIGGGGGVGTGDPMARALTESQKQTVFLAEITKLLREGGSDQPPTA